MTDTHTRNMAQAQWKRHVRELTNERIINLPKQIQFLQTGDAITITMDGERLTIEKTK